MLNAALEQLGKSNFFEDKMPHGISFHWKSSVVIVHIFLFLDFDPCQVRGWPQVASSEKVYRKNFLNPRMV